MFKFLHRFDLTNLYERYSRLVTYEGSKQFARTVYTFSVLIVAITIVWYLGIVRLSSQAALPLEIQEITQDSKQGSISESTQEIAKDSTQEITQESSKISSAEQTQESSVDSLQGQIEINIPSTPSPSSMQPSVTSKVYNIEPLEQAIEKMVSIHKGANKPQVSLTFDDGYDKKLVNKVLDVLKKKDIKTTFFIIGGAIARNPDVWKRAVNEGHQICNHTSNHKNMSELSDNQVQAEIVGWETTVKKYLGEDYLLKMKNEFPLLRLPGGNGGKSKRILSIAQKNGYAVIAWDVETYSSIIKPLVNTHSVADISERIEKHVVNKCSKGSIILLHFNQYDVGNLEEMVDGILKKGYEIKPVSQMLK